METSFNISVGVATAENTVEIHMLTRQGFYSRMRFVPPISRRRRLLEEGFLHMPENWLLFAIEAEVDL